MGRGNSFGYPERHVRRQWEPSDVACCEPACDRPNYLDGRCKKHHDEFMYRAGLLPDYGDDLVAVPELETEPEPEEEPVTLASLMAAGPSHPDILL